MAAPRELPHRPTSRELRTSLDAALGLLRKDHMAGGSLVRLSPRSRVVLLGDTEGKDALPAYAFDRFLEDPGTTLVFLGDYVDRGRRQVENVYGLLTAVQRAPGRVLLVRGNHETEDVAPHDFLLEMQRKYGAGDGRVLYGLVMQFFTQLPYAAVVNDYFCVHGGIPEPVPRLEELGGLQMGLLAPLRETGDPERAEVQLLWNDPASKDLETRLNGQGFCPNHDRGVGRYYGQRAVEDFLHRNRLKGVLRGHERVSSGVDFLFGALVSTINETGFPGSPEPLQALLILEGDRMRAEIFPSKELAHPSPETVAWAEREEQRANAILERNRPG